MKKNAIMEIRDGCRQNLAKYTVKAFFLLPAIERPNILEIGCGTGVPTMELARITDGTIFALEPDSESCNILRDKVRKAGNQERIKVIHCTLEAADLPVNFFDIVWAEGLLNIIGFEEGLALGTRFLKDKGYFVIHDEIKNGGEKRRIIARHGYSLIDSFMLNRNAWLQGYYGCMEKHLSVYMSTHPASGYDARAFEKELRDIAAYRENPENLRSIFYILKRKVKI
jgi:ubiquinone/menaquinone biosynthesis C-methylase UbiE